MAHRFSKRHGQPSRREQKLKEEQARREFEQQQAKRAKRMGAVSEEKKPSPQTGPSTQIVGPGL